MTKKPISLTLGLLAALLMVVGCESSSSSSDSTTASTEINSLSDLPSFNLENFDPTQEATSSTSSKIGLKGQAGDFSRPGCEILALFYEGVRLGSNFESFRCYIGAADEASDVLELTSEATVYNLIFGEESDESEEEHEGPPAQVKVRISKVDNRVLMDVCEPDEDGNLVQTIALDLTSSEENITGTLKEKHQFRGEGEEAEAEEETMNLSVTLTPVEGSDEFSAEVDASFSGSHGTGLLQVTADEENNTLQVEGAHQNNDPNFGNFDIAIAGIYGLNSDGNAIGSSKVNISSGHPAPDLDQCVNEFGLSQEEAQLFCVNKCYDEQGEETAAVDGLCEFSLNEVESFSVEVDLDADEFEPTILIVDDSSSPHFDTVSALTLLDADDASPEAPSGWDCTGDAIDVDLTAVDFSSCEEGDEKDLFNYCHEQEQQENGEDQGDA